MAELHHVLQYKLDGWYQWKYNIIKEQLWLLYPTSLYSTQPIVWAHPCYLSGGSVLYIAKQLDIKSTRPDEWATSLLFISLDSSPVRLGVQTF